MKKNYGILKKCSLFYNFSEEEIAVITEQPGIRIKSYAKNSVIRHIGDKASAIGIVLNGKVRIETQDYWGNRSILAVISEGDMFGEAFFFAETQHIPVNVLCAESSEIMFFSFVREKYLMKNDLYIKLTENMLKTLAEKNIMLTAKIEHITKRTTREKLLSFLSHQAMKQESNIFDIPFNRQELADFLAVDRSAMSNELSKLRKSGVLDFNKNHFHLYPKES